ncbi:hypothetical protein ACLB2K_068864 [Fragaria x ananassa]
MTSSSAVANGIGRSSSGRGSTRLNFLALAQNTTIPVNVGVILDLDTGFGKLGLSCIEMALSDFYASHALIQQ